VHASDADVRRPRHAFVVRDPDTISPLGAPASEAWLLGGRLFPQMRAHLERAGLTVEIVDTLDEAARRAADAPDGAIVTRDSVAFTRPVLDRLLAAFAKDTAPALQAALPDADVTRRLAPIDGLTPVEGGYAAPLWAIARGGSLDDARPAILPLKEHVAKIPLPPGMMGKPEAPLGLSDTYLCRVDHWVHILRINQSALIAHWAERAGRWGGRLWFLWRALCGFPWRRGRLAGAIHQIHRKAKVHHTAHVELSVIEAGAEIGAHAIVKNSWIGRGARVDDGAILNGTVVAERAFVSSASAITGAVLYPQSFAAQQKMQLCVFGEGAVAFTGSYFYDLNFEKSVRVMHRGRAVEVGDQFTSVCLGPWSRIAGGVWIASGREVPAGALIVQPPAHVLHRVDEQLAASQMTTIADAALVGLGPIPKNHDLELPAAPAALGPGRPADDASSRS
jgi:hypothetical protein